MPARRSNCSSSHHLTKLALSYAWYPITLVDKLTSRHDRRRKRQPSSKKSWIIAGYARPRRPAPCPICNWGERTLCPATRLRPARLTRTPSPFGKTPIRLFLSSRKLRRSTESCSKAVATKNHLGPNALVRAGERSSPVTKASYEGKIAELRSAGRVRAPAPTCCVPDYTSLMCVAMYHWLPNGSCTPPLRSPYGWSCGSAIEVAPAASARR